MNKFDEYVKIRPDIVERFWTHVDKKEPEECWNWKSRTKSGYGMFRVTMQKKESEFVASRVSLFLSGTPVNGFFALHSCDNPKCVNPGHLRAGTHKENMEDMVAKGRWRGGRPRKHFKEPKIKEIVITHASEIA